MRHTRLTGRPFPYDRVTTMRLPTGDDGTMVTLSAMAQLVRHARRTTQVQSVVRELRQRSGGNTAEYLRSVFAFLRRRVEFKADPDNTELVRHPAQLLTEIQQRGVAYGDCDDRSTLGAALLYAAGVPTAFVVIGPAQNRPMEHVYFAGRVGGDWVPLDPQETDTPGTEVAHRRRWLYKVF